MTVVRTPAKVAVGIPTFAVVFVAFVVSARSCVKAIWPKEFASTYDRARIAWEDTHGSPR